MSDEERWWPSDWQSPRGKFSPIHQFCDWTGRSDYDRINTPVISGTSAAALVERVEAVEDEVRALRSALLKAKGEAGQ